MQLIDALTKAIRSAARHNPDVQVPPACILWPDGDRQWEPVVPRLQNEMPELHSEGGIGADPLEPGQVWTISPGGMDENPGLYRIEVNEGPGSGVKVLNKPVPTAFRESVGYAEQNLYPRASQLVGEPMRW